MARYICINCGTFIIKSAFSDPYLCRDCEKLLEGVDEKKRYTYLDNYWGKMKLHQQFDLNLDIVKIENFNDIPKAINEIPLLVEKLTKDLLERGYIVIESSAKHMGIPQSIIVIKDFTGPFVTKFSTKIQNDFNAVSKTLGIEKLFE